MNEKINDDRNQRPGCNVNSTFNFIVGVLAIAAVFVIGYLLYIYR
jgi:hypothetical protein